MNRLLRTLLIGSFTFALGTAALADEGTGQKAGKKVDDAADKTSAEAKKAGRATKKAAKKVKNKTGEAVEEAGDKMQN
jgi:hypothetical protein